MEKLAWEKGSDYYFARTNESVIRTISYQKRGGAFGY
jgi:hypothetical protein